MLHIRPSIVWTIKSSTWSSSMDALSMDDFIVVYRQRPRMTLLSSKEALGNCMLYPCLRNFSLVMIPDLIRSHGHGRSLWTNWRWTNFSVSYQYLCLPNIGLTGSTYNWAHNLFVLWALGFLLWVGLCLETQSLTIVFASPPLSPTKSLPLLLK